MQCDALLFNACKDSVLGPVARADDPNRWVAVASLGAGQCKKSAEKLELSTESSEEPRDLSHAQFRNCHVFDRFGHYRPLAASL